jgi:hypothetical protein
MASAVVTAAVLITVAVVVLLLWQGSVGRLSEEAGRRPARDDVVERPAGPDAEPMHSDPPNRFPGDLPAPPGDQPR